MLWKYFQNCMYSFRENLEINLSFSYAALRFNPQFVYNFTEIESTFPVLLWDYVADCLWLHGMISICLISKRKYDWFLQEGLLLDWLNFLLYLQTICLLFKIFCQDNKFFFLKSISWFHTSVCPETSQNSCYCSTI